jgi:peroxiredoxin
MILQPIPIVLLFFVSIVIQAQHDSAQSPIEAPAIVVHRPYRVGEMVPDFAFTTIDGKAITLTGYAAKRPVVIAIRDCECPLSQKYGPTLALLEREFAEKGVKVLFVNPSGIDSPQSMRAERESFGFSGAYAADQSGLMSHALGATRTTEIFLLDEVRTLIYRGAIDDQYGLGYSLDAPRREFLREAVEAMLARTTPEVQATTAPGCDLSLPDFVETAVTNGAEHAEIVETYHNRISRIIQQNCETCHREGGVGPFTMTTYDEAKGRRNMIRSVIERGLMPPWHADPATSHDFINDRSLSERDRKSILAWIEAGCPDGDASDAPVAREWPTGWHIGTPDAVLAINETYDVPASGAVRYKYTWVKTDFAEDRWIKTMEIRPTHPEVVHHVLVFLEDPPGENEDREAVRARWQGGLEGYFAGLVPGQSWTEYPEGTAKRLPAGAWLKFQIHYTPNGTAVRDRTEIGFIFQDDPPAHEMITASAMTTRFEIPPGSANHEVVATTKINRPGVIQSFAPHMHVRGKAFKYEFIYPDGTKELVLDIPRYDFNWQTRYLLREPIHVPAGTQIKATAWFDNSPENPANPDPTDTVHFGEQTWEEMMIGYFEYWREEREE